MHCIPRFQFLPFLAAGLFAVTSLLRAELPLDHLLMGKAESEQLHALRSGQSELVDGEFGQPARRLFPKSPASWEGNSITFRLAVAPHKQNYVTAKFWGSECGDSMGRLYLFCEGKQVGWRHLGSVDPLDIAYLEPMAPGRFFYTTVPLPRHMTTGKTVIDLEIRAGGQIWPYGDSWERYQKPLTGQSRSVYAVYSHTDPYFTPLPEEQQGGQIVGRTRTQPGVEVLDELKSVVGERIDGLIQKPLDVKALKDPKHFIKVAVLARATRVKWTSAYHNRAALDRVVAMIDEMIKGYQTDNKLPTRDWHGFGDAGEALHVLRSSIGPYLDEKIDFDGNPATAPVSRRVAWAEGLFAGREYWRMHRRSYTNQSMIIDLKIYLSNRGLQVIGDKRAWSESVALRYLYEAMGLEPWRGADTAEGNHDYLGYGTHGEHTVQLPNYFQITKKGLTRELGYVGGYGEVLDWVVQIFLATVGPESPAGDQKIAEQVVKIANARGWFRYPSEDSDGCRTMMLESVIGWRDSRHPGGAGYAQRTNREGTAIQLSTYFPTASAVGYSQQMLADNQYFSGIKTLLKDAADGRTLYTLLNVPAEYAALEKSPKTGIVLPTTEGQRDFVFADEENGVVAVKRGREILYISLYWRARKSINFLARVHHITPELQRVAIIETEAKFIPSGLTYTIPDLVDMETQRAHEPPGEFHQAFAGMEQPIAKMPAGVTNFEPGQESPFAGRASFYTCRYGPYLIAMNCTSDRLHRLTWPAGESEALDLTTQKAVGPDAQGGQAVLPGETVVLWFGKR